MHYTLYIYIFLFLIHPQQLSQFSKSYELKTYQYRKYVNIDKLTIRKCMIMAFHKEKLYKFLYFFVKGVFSSHFITKNFGF